MPPVHFFGYLGASTGLGEAGRLILRALLAADIDVQAYHVPQAGRTCA